MDNVKRTESRTEPARLSRSDELILALAPTATVLLMLGLVKALGHERLLCVSLASSAFLVYRDPEHETNAIRALLVSQITAAGIGLMTWSQFGPGFMSAGISMASTIHLMSLFNAVHPPAVSTALAFALRADHNSNFVSFGLAVALTIVLIALKHLCLWLFANRRRRAERGNVPAGVADRTDTPRPRR
jgi:CBS-domain-containing membrane protein